MKEVNKISEDELKAIQTAISNVNQAKTILGEASMQVHIAQMQVLELDKTLQEEQKNLEEKYGSISVDITTGEYKDIVEE